MSLKTIINFFGLRTPRHAPRAAAGSGPDSPTAGVASSAVTVGSREVPLLMVRHRRARRYLLRLGPDGSARVTIPPRGTLEGARAFVERNRKWLAAQLSHLPSSAGPSASLKAGDQIWFRGERLPLAVLSSGQVQLGTERLAVPETPADLRPFVERHLQRLAKQELPALVARLAAQHGFSGNVKRVTIRNQRTRWGSCSSRGTISLNWRLIQAPDFVRDYIILHELAHFRHMNHSARFWQDVKRLCPDQALARQWLKEHRQLLP